MNKRFQRLQKQFKQRFLRTKRHRRYWLYGLGVTLITLLCLSLWHNHATAQADHLKVIKQLQTKETQRQSLNKALQSLQKQKADTDSQLQDKARKQSELESQIQDLNNQLQTKREQQSLLARAAQAVVPKAAAEPAVIASCGDNSYANFIYSHESGCNLNAINAIGCRGIGQSCPGSKLPCGADYACQNAFFTAYANSAYGGWAGAYSFWLSHHWW